MNYLDLANCGKWFSGNTPTKNIKTYWGGNIPWISASSMNTDYIHDSSEKITDIAANEYAIIVPQNSIIILVRGSTLLKYVPICLTKKEVAINQDVKAIVANEKIDPFYLFYSLKAKERDIYNIVEFTGIGAGKLSTDRLKAIQVFCPNISIQKKVASFFKTLDDKIELNRRMNETLESIARAIFKSWFIDFDPVRAKAEGRQPEGMDATTADLFPSEFEEFEGQEIPKGWVFGSINDICSSIENGGTPKRMEPSFWENGTIPWFKTGELKDEPIFGSTERITEVGLNNSACRLWDKGTILFALYASPTLGRMGILEIEGTANQACSALIAKKEYGSLFLYYSLFFAREHLQNIAVGAAQQNINQQVLRNHKILLPSEKLAGKFHSNLLNLYQKKVSNLKENLILTDLRDTLLPKLLSGELSITNPEKFTGVS